jgi:hypothetical protein
MDVSVLPGSRQTIVRRLKAVNRIPRRAVRKFFLSPQHIQDRFEFAALHAYRDAQWWRSVIFTDDKTFGYL